MGDSGQLALNGGRAGRRAASLTLAAGLVGLVTAAAVALPALHREIERRRVGERELALTWSAERVRTLVAVLPGDLAKLAGGYELRLAVATAPEEGVEPVAGEPAAPAPLETALGRSLAAGERYAGLVVVDPGGEVRAAAGEGPELESLLGVLQAKDAVEAALVDLMQTAQLRRELGGVTAPALRVFAMGAAPPALLVSVPLRGDGGEQLASLHGLVRRAGLASRLRADLLGSGGGVRLVDPTGRELAAAGAGAPGADAAQPGMVLDELGWTLFAAAPALAVYKTLVGPLLQLFAIGLPLVALLALLAWRAAGGAARVLGPVFEGLRQIARGEETAELSENAVAAPFDSVYRAFNSAAQKLGERRGREATDLRALREQNVAFQRQHELLARLSVTDGLTELHNHRYFQDQLRREVKRLGRTGEGLTMLILDIDDFKQLNDRHGHAAGDEFLKQLARILRESVRETDLVARYGGEEFVILTPGTSSDGAIILAEKLRTAIAETSFIVDESMRPRRVTVSIGVAQFKHSRTELFAAADAALYRAKAAGKNCVVVAGEDEEEPEA